MKLFLHIGTIKTGTKTAQAWFSANRSVLRQVGVWYPELGGAWHRWLAVIGMGSGHPGNYFYDNSIKTPENYSAFVSHVGRQFDIEYQQALDAGLPYCVMSSEHLQARLYDDEMVARIAGFTKAYFSAVEVIVYLRPQVDLVVSAATTASLMGERIDREWFLGSLVQGKTIDYDDLVRRWARIFGASNVRCLSYRRDPPLPEVAIKAFSVDRGRIRNVGNLNESFSVQRIALNNAHAIPHFYEDGVENKNAEIPFDQLPSGDRISIGLELAQQIQDKFTKSNKALTSGRKDILLEDLEPDWTHYDRPSNVHLLEMDCPYSKELGALVQFYNAAVHLERARLGVASADLSLLRNEPGPAGQLLHAAMSELGAAERVASLKASVDQVRAIAAALAKRLSP